MKNFQDIIEFDNQKYLYFNITKASASLNFNILNMPFVIKIVFENLIRHLDGISVKEDDIRYIANLYNRNIQTNNFNTIQKDYYLGNNSKDCKNSHTSREISFYPSRVLMQDFTGVPAMVDLTAMRNAVSEMDGDSKLINPLINVDLVIDHSVQVDSYLGKSALHSNVTKEFTRNKERYEFLRWGQKSFRNFRVVPPGTGICHQVNLEYLSKVVWQSPQNKDNSITLYPDTLVGTDSHTTMINALGVLGWGVGGIEAEAAMLGQPLTMLLPHVLGVKLHGSLKAGVTATDLVLTITTILRKKGVVGKFVEFFGPGLKNLSLADRATISNMSPEFGSTCAIFPIDKETTKYLRLTGRPENEVQLVEKYAKLQNMWYDAEIINQNIEPIYNEIIEINISEIESSIAGPKRPQDHIKLHEAKPNLQHTLKKEMLNRNDIAEQSTDHATINAKNGSYKLKNGDVVISAITSCTNTSNPSVMIGAGLVAQKARALGLQTKPWVKTSLAPGSQVVTKYLSIAGLDKDLEALGFFTVGYGCTTCIGNSGPLLPEIEKAIKDNKLLVSAVLSGNRNFEGRIHPLTRMNYLASPMLCVIYAITGTMNIDLINEAIGHSKEGQEIFMHDIWPTTEEINSILQKTIDKSIFITKYSQIFVGDENWNSLQLEKNDSYSWNQDSTYIRKPNYFDEMINAYKNYKNTAKKDKAQSINTGHHTTHDTTTSSHSLLIQKAADACSKLQSIKKAHILAILGDSTTTDHISPAGSIAKDSPAAKYLREKGVLESDFNSYGSRRGNHEVMLRGTFANTRIRNKIFQNQSNNLEGEMREGGITILHSNGKIMSIYDAAMAYKKHNTPLVIFAGKEYGTGSSRDWAAKGTALLGIKAVIAESFERIHRSNLIGMGVIPFTIKEKLDDLQLKGNELVTIDGINQDIEPGSTIQCTIENPQNTKDKKTLNLVCRIDTELEKEYLKKGGILQYAVTHLFKKTNPQK